MSSNLAVKRTATEEEALPAVTQEELDTAGFHGCVICQKPCPGAKSIYPPTPEGKRKSWKLVCSEYEHPVSVLETATCEKFWIFINKVDGVSSNVVDIRA